MIANRKASTKSIPRLLANFDNCTEEELDRLRGQAFWFDRNKSENDERLEEVQECLLAKERKTIIFDKPVYEIKHTLLAKQFQDLKTEQKASRFILTHDFKPNTAFYTSLFHWPCFSTVQSIFNPVHFQLFQRKREQMRTMNNNNNNARQQQRLSPLTLMQDLLVRSQREEPKLKTEEIILGLEDLLDATMIDIIINGFLVVFIFDWKAGDENDSQQQFKIHIAFSFHQPTSLLLSSLPNPHHTIILESSDLYDHYAGDGGNQEQMEPEESRVSLNSGSLQSTGLDLKSIRRFLRQSKLSYYYYGFSLK